MGKKVFKYKSELINHEITFTYDKKLDKFQGKVYNPEKLEEINRMLRNLKGPLPKGFAKKVYKSQSGLFGEKVTYTFDENLEKLNGKILAPKKLEEANKLLRNLKTPLPK